MKNDGTLLRSEDGRRCRRIKNIFERWRSEKDPWMCYDHKHQKYRIEEPGLSVRSLLSSHFRSAMVNDLVVWGGLAALGGPGLIYLGIQAARKLSLLPPPPAPEGGWKTFEDEEGEDMDEWDKKDKKWNEK
eukprot:g69766.t1